jgi:hypothetical protein
MVLNPTADSVGQSSAWHFQPIALSRVANNDNGV